MKIFLLAIVKFKTTESRARRRNKKSKKEKVYKTLYYRSTISSLNGYFRDIFPSFASKMPNPPSFPSVRSLLLTLSYIFRKNISVGVIRAILSHVFLLTFEAFFMRYTFLRAATYP